MIHPFSFKKLLFGNYENVEITKEYFFKKVKTGDWKDRFVFGVTEIDRGFAEFDPLSNAGALFFGGTGSGKSQGMKFTTFTHYATNNEHTLYILFDCAKGANDYLSLMPFKDNVVTAVNSADKFLPLMDFIHTEYEARRLEFSRVGAAHIYEYNNIMKEKDPNAKELARIFLIFEEFHALIDDPKVQITRNIDRPETAAGKMKYLSRLARASGMYLFIATQRANSDDVPADYKQWIKIPVGFRVSTASDAHAVGLDKACDIPADKPGRCVYGQNFWMQYPLISNAFFGKLIKETKKPFNARFINLKIEDLHTALSGGTAENYVFVKSFSDIVNGHSQFNKTLITQRFLEKFGFEVKPQKNIGYYCRQIAIRDGKKYVVFTPQDDSGDRSHIGKATIQNVKESIKDLDCDGLINFSFDGMSDALEDICDDGGIHLSHEDLLYAANIIDNSESFKEQELIEKYKKIPLSKDYVSGMTEDGDDEPVVSRPRNMGRRYNHNF